MIAGVGVLGCVGLCRVGFPIPTRLQASIHAGCGVLLRVCRVFPRARACAQFSRSSDGMQFFPYATPENPNKPNTLNTVCLKSLIYKGFSCVGFVSGWAFLCWVGVSGEMTA